VRAVLPFWRRLAIDTRGGGYHLNHGPTGEDLGPAPRHIVAQSRTLWFFSRLVQTPWGEAGDMVAVRQGFDFLAAKLWDQRYGGFAWEVLDDGEPLHPHKHALAQINAILALVEYWRATGDSRALALAEETFDLWDRAAHDPVAGGYVEMHLQNWAPAQGIPGYWASDPGLKMLDTHLHIADGLAALHEVAPGTRLQMRLAELLRILSTVDAADPCGVSAFSRDWTPLPKRRIEYGFDVKRIVLTVRSCRVLGQDPCEHLDLFTRLFDNAIRWGWDRRRGGLFEAGAPGRRAHELTKPWWTQAELLAASALMGRLTGETAYLGIFLRTLGWVERWQVDWEHGDWHARVDHRGRPAGKKAWAWKGPYHVARCLLECRGLLEDAILSPASI